MRTIEVPAHPQSNEREISPDHPAPGGLMPARSLSQHSIPPAKGKTTMSETEQRSGSETNRTIGRAGSAVKVGVIRSLHGIYEIETEIVYLVRHTVADSLKTAGSLTAEAGSITKDVVTGAIRATEEVGTGLILSTKSVVKGALIGVNDIGGDVLSVIDPTVKSAVKTASEIGGDVAMVARRAVEGIIEATREVGGNANEAAKIAVTGALDAARSISRTAARSVKDILVGVVEGISDVAGNALPKR